MQINILIVDDIEDDAKRIKELCEKFNQEFFEFDFSIFNQASNPDILAKEYDIYFLDIEMPEINGLDLSRQISEKHQHAKIVFVSMKDDLVFESFKFNTIYFVRKANFEEEFKSAFNKIIKLLNFSDKKIEVNADNVIIDIPLNNIIYIESKRNNIIIKTRSKNFVVRKTLKSIINEINSNNFLAVHSSYYINLNCISKFNNDNFVMANNEIVPISFRKRKDVREKYYNYLMKNI